eukprot:g42525.t1
MWYYGTVKTDPNKDDVLVAIYCCVLAAPGETYKSPAGTFTVPGPWYKFMVEVLDKGVSKELAMDFYVKGVTPLPEMSRAFNGGVKANRKLASHKISIPSLIEASKQRFRVIMIFNIATYRRGVSLWSGPRVGVYRRSHLFSDFGGFITYTGDKGV